MRKSTDFKALLKAAEPSLREYISALESENLKLQRQIVKFQVNEVSSKNRIAALEQEVNKQGHASLTKLYDLIQEKSSEELKHPNVIIP